MSKAKSPALKGTKRSSTKPAAEKETTASAVVNAEKIVAIGIRMRRQQHQQLTEIMQEMNYGDPAGGKVTLNKLLLEGVQCVLEKYDSMIRRTR